MLTMSIETTRRYVERERAKVTTPRVTGRANGLELLLDMPIELALEVISLLDIVDIALLSLTCKDAFHFIRSTDFGSTSATDLRNALMTKSPSMFLERARFLHLLADDYPYLFVCQRCSKLHQYESLAVQGQYAREYTVIVRGRRDPSLKGLMTFGPLWPQYALSFNRASEIIRHTCDGLNPRAPVADLALSTDWKLARLGTSCNNPDMTHGYVKLDAEAVIVGGCLFFHKTHRVLLQPEKVMGFLRINASYPMDQIFKGCCHGLDPLSSFFPPLGSLGWSRFKGMSIHEMVSEFVSMARKKAGLREAPGPEGWDLSTRHMPTYALHGCRDCTTDSAITIHNHGRAGVEIILDVFQELGSCSEPRYNDWEYCWSGHGGLRYANLSRRRSDYPQVDVSLFPTPPGRSGMRHQSAPTARDVWELHEHQRVAKMTPPRSLRGKGPRYAVA
ncbi:hypothetical protein F4677DRAFT_421412 [Hypoxylon crocopeplum]|nr:hypothetical protein F4677DRAFT_421412 [Hypoxylon crocopeplum]